MINRFTSASISNLRTVDRIQQKAGRINTGLHHSYISEIVLFNADLLPFRERRGFRLVKNVNKLLSYGVQHITVKCLLN